MSGVTIDLSNIATLAASDFVAKQAEEKIEDALTGIYVDLTAPSPIGTPVDTGVARNGWQLDLPNRQITNLVKYIGVLAFTDHSKKSPLGWFVAIIDKWTRR